MSVLDLGLGDLPREIRPCVKCDFLRYVQLTVKSKTQPSLAGQATVAIGAPAFRSSTAQSDETDRVVIARGHGRLCAADVGLDDLSGRVFEQYELGKRIGQGGMGQVFLARHRHLGKSVAIKFIRHDVLCKEAQSRFLQEIQAVGRLNHPHLIHAIDAGDRDGMLYCVTEYLEGCDLQEWVRIRGAMPPKAAAEVIRQAAIGLQHAHQQGFVHRDIKPSNIFLERHGNIRVLDFGLAYHEKQPADLTRQGQLLGTVDYISPEQAKYAHAATRQSDLYSLGASMVYLLSKKAPFPDDQYPALTNKLLALTTSLPPYLGNCADLPNPIREVLQRTLNIEPSQRFQSAREIVTALETVACKDELANWMIHGDETSKPVAIRASNAMPASRLYWGFIVVAVTAVVPFGLVFNRPSRRSESSIAAPLRTVAEVQKTPASVQAKTIVHQSGSSRNAKAIGIPSKKLSESISNKKGVP